MKRLLALTAAASLAAILAACSPGPGTRAVSSSVSAAPSGSTSSESTSAALAVLRSAVESDLAQPVTLQPVSFKARDGFAFVTAGALSANGRPVDFRRTRYRAAIDAGMFDSGDQPIIALLQFEHGRWQLKDYLVGPTDVAFAEWWRIHGAPKSIFPFTE